MVKRNINIILILLTIIFIVSSCSGTKEVISSKKIKFIGEYTFSSDTHFKGTLLGGLSGLNYDEKKNILYALSDDSGNPKRPPLNTSRIYKFKIDMNSKKFEVHPEEILFLKKEGKVLPNGFIDPEAISIIPSGKMLISSEGQVYKRAADNLVPALPQILIFDLKGNLQNEISLPRKFLPKDRSNTYGIRSNSGHEGLTTTTDGNVLYTMTENSLGQDYKYPNYLRFSVFKKAGKSYDYSNEYIYEIDEIPNNLGFEPTDISTGVSEILYVMNNHFLAIERTFVSDQKTHQRNIIKIYEFWLNKETTDVSKLTSLDNVKVLKKELLINLDSIIPLLDNKDNRGGTILDNQEGMTWGPVLNGRKTLILVSDNHFRSIQRTLFLAFSIEI